MGTKLWKYTREELAEHKYNGGLDGEQSPKRRRLVIPQIIKAFIVEKNRVGVTANPIAVALKSTFRGQFDNELLESITVVKVQNFLKNCLREAAPHLTLTAITDKVVGRGYCDGLQDHQGFTFGYDLDEDLNPILGLGTDDDPFVICFSSKAWFNNFFRAKDLIAAEADVTRQVFMLHIDGSFKLNLLGYPVIVLGISDASRNFHPLGVAIVSQTTTAILSAVIGKFETFTEEVYPSNCPWCQSITHCMMDADVAEYNAVHERFQGRVIVLMCYFHVMYNVHKRCKGLPKY